MSNEQKNPSTRESYRRRKDRERVENRLGNVLGWKEDKQSADRKQTKSTTKQEDDSQATKMFSLNDAAVKKDQPKRTTIPRTAARQAWHPSTSRSNRADSLSKATNPTTKQKKTPKTNSSIDDQSFWQIERSNLDRYLTVGIIVLIIGILLLTIVALYF
ncbi:hypothetical protein [Aerococcus vaginalis]